MTIADLLPVAAESLLCLGGAVLAVTAGVIRKRKATDVYPATAILLLASGILAFFFDGGPAPVLNGAIEGGLFILFFKLLLIGCAFLSLAMTRYWLRREDLDSAAFPVLTLFSTLGGMLALSSGNLVFLYLSLETMGAPLYFMAALRRRDPRSTGAGLKWFMSGFLQSALFVFGVALLVGALGGVRLDAMAALFVEKGAPPLAAYGMALVLFSLAFRLGAAPLHLGKTDIYEGAPGAAAVFFSIAPLIVIAPVMVRLMAGPFAGGADMLGPVLAVFGVLSLLVAGAGAMFETSIRKLAGFLALGVIGQCLLGLGSGGTFGGGASLVALIVAIPALFGLYAIFLSMRVRNMVASHLSDLSGMSRTHPLRALGLALFALSLAGAPPLAGFWGKLSLFRAAVEDESPLIALSGILSWALLACGALRIVSVAWFERENDPLDRSNGPALDFVMILCAFLILLCSIFPHPLLGGVSALIRELYALHV